MSMMIVVPELANQYGLHEALVLGQMHYWLQRATVFDEEGRPWVYKSISEWAEEFTWWSRSTVHRLLQDLAVDELILIRQADGRTYYTIHYAELTPAARRALFMLSENRTGEPRRPSENRTDALSNDVMLSESETALSENGTEKPPKDVMLSENRTPLSESGTAPSENRTAVSENRTAVSENRTAHYKEYTETTTEITTETTQKAAAAAAAAADPPPAPAPSEIHRPLTSPTRPSPRLRELWQRNMSGTLTPLLCESLAALEQAHPFEHIERAIAIAVDRDKRTLAYVRGILARGVDSPSPISAGGNAPRASPARPASKVQASMDAVDRVFARLKEQGVIHP